jgi:integrase
MSKSTSQKPQKPYPEFPLCYHASGRYYKKIRGRFYYFGWYRGANAIPWQDALAQYQKQRDDLYAGRTPRVEGEGLTIADLCNRFLSVKQNLLDAGELTPRSFEDYYKNCALLVSYFGRNRLVSDLASDDFERLRASMSRKWGAVRLGGQINLGRGVFKYAHEAGLIDRPVCFGPGFKKPSKKVLRKLRIARGPRLFTRNEIHALLGAVSIQVRAMILCGVNLGYGNSDVARLSVDHLDLKAGFVDFPRPKTGQPRRAALWPETVAAIKEALAVRPKPKDPADADKVFLTRYGSPWVQAVAVDVTGDNGERVVRVSRDDALCNELRKAMKSLGFNGSRGFYTLRHTYRTVADEVKDQPAIDFTMGHESAHMANVYRERIDDSRLLAVAEHVRGWLFGSDNGMSQ